MLRSWRGLVRGALLAVCLWPVQAAALEITSARFSGPTDLYGHLVLGKSHNWSTLEVTFSDGTSDAIVWDNLVFEDISPRLVDMNGDGSPEVMVVEAAPGEGARISFYGVVDGRLSLRAATPHIGTNNRWYSPVGATDLDGDGVVEFAFVDRPHLARILRVWRYTEVGEDVRLEEVTTMGQVTNHRIGEDWISGGLRDCGQGPEMVVASANWGAVLGITFDGASLQTATLGNDTSRAGFNRAMDCAK